jgi:flagellar basal body-associated protein FliL
MTSIFAFAAILMIIVIATAVVAVFFIGARCDDWQDEHAEQARPQATRHMPHATGNAPQATRNKGPQA